MCVLNRINNLHIPILIKATEITTSTVAPGHKKKKMKHQVPSYFEDAYILTQDLLGEEAYIPCVLVSIIKEMEYAVKIIKKRAEEVGKKRTLLNEINLYYEYEDP